jgi:hypothetical protein
MGVKPPPIPQGYFQRRQGTVGPPPLPGRVPPPLPGALTPPDMPFNRGRPGETRWRAQDRHVAVGDNRDLGAVAFRQYGTSEKVQALLRKTQSEMSWRPGPPTSHIHSFALWDARLLLATKTIDGEYVVTNPADLPPSRIYVRFRPSPAGLHKTKRRGTRAHKARAITQYVYYSSEHSKLKDIYQQMAGSSHPGKIVYAKLQEEIPYQRVY